MTKIIEFNGLRFTKLTVKEDAVSLEKKEINFFYKKLKHGIRFYTPNKEVFAFLSTHSYAPFFVTANDSPEGIRYMFTTTKHTDKMLNLEGLSYRQRLDKQEFASKAFSA